MSSMKLRSLPRACATFLLLAVLAACSLPNPYVPPSPRPTQPPSGQPPQVPPQPGETPVPQQPPGEPVPQRPTRTFTLSPPSRALVTQAQEQAQNGDVTAAAATVERALRIEPSNPLLWIELGKLRMREASYGQAESVGRKAVSLATGDARAESAAWSLIADSFRARGRNAEAREADERAAQLRPQ